MKTVAIFLSIIGVAQAQYSISTLAGTIGPAVGSQATSVYVPYPGGVAWDSSGRFYFSGQNSNQVYRVNRNGVIDLIIGNGHKAVAGDGSVAMASNVSLSIPGALTVDKAGNLYIVDGYSCVRKVDAVTGIIQTVAGIAGSFGYLGDGNPATSASLYFPGGIAVDGSGNLYIADNANFRVRMVNASSGIISTIAGNGVHGSSGNGVLATSAQIHPTGLAVDGSGNLYISDAEFDYVRKYTPGTGIISTVAGNGGYGEGGDGGPATSAPLQAPQSIAVDAAGNLYIFVVDRIRKVSLGGTITTYAGSGTIGPYTGENGPATAATIPVYGSLAINSSGDLLVGNPVDYLIHKIDGVTSTITTVAGTTGAPGDNGPASSAQFSHPTSVAVDSFGNVYVGDGGAGRVRKISASTGVITTVAGNGSYFSSGDGGLATNAGLGRFLEQDTSLLPIAIDPSDNLYIMDHGTIRRVAASTAMITTIAGGGTLLPEDALGGPATAAYLGTVTALAVDQNNLYLLDVGSNGAIRKVDLRTGMLSSIASLPTGLTFWSNTAFDRDPKGNFYYGGNYSILKVAAGSTTSTISVNTNPCQPYTCPALNAPGEQLGDGEPAANAQLTIPADVKADKAGNIYIADSEHERIRFVSADTGLISTIGGSVGFDCAVTPGPALNAQFGGLYGLAVDSGKTVYMVDRVCATVHKMSLPVAYVGYVDGANCQTISGWAADQRRPGQSIRVSIYDGSTLLATITANQLRGDVGAYLGDNGLHGFSYKVPANLQDGRARTLHVKFETSDIEASGSPKTLTCGSPYTGSVDTASCSGVTGWVADRSRPNVPITVSLWDGDTQVASTTANLSRPDVGAAVGDNGLHGFSMAIPAGIKNGASHTLQVRFESSTIQAYGSPFTVSCTSGLSYAGYVDSASCSGVTGWVADKNRLNQAITVSLWDGSTMVTSTTANGARPDVGAYLGDNGLHAFRLVLPAAYADGVARSLQVRYESSATAVPNSPVSLKCGTVSAANYAGYVDTATCNTITGWAADRTRPNVSIQVSLWANGSQIATASAYYSRPDVGAVLGDNGAHGFVLPIPDGYNDSANHGLQVRYESSGTALPNLPAQLSCTSPPNYTGAVDVLSCASISGWAANRSLLNSSISVNIFDGSTLLASTPANGSRPDVGSYLGDNGQHGFGVGLPASVRDGKAHTVTVLPGNSTTPLYGPQSLTCH